MVTTKPLLVMSLNLVAIIAGITSGLLSAEINKVLPETSFSMAPVRKAQPDSEQPKERAAAKPYINKRNKGKKKILTPAEKKKKRGLKNMSYEDLKIAKNKALTEKRTDEVIRFLEKMVPLCNDLSERHNLMLETADIFFEAQNYNKAGTLYKEFITLYPGSAKLEYAHYKAIACNYHQMSDAERDQTKTKETIDLAKTFLEREATFTTYTPKVKEMLAECQKRLMDSDLNVLNFYIGRGYFKSAQKRLDLLRKDFVPVLPKAEPLILSLEYNVACAQNNLQLAAQKKLDLEQQFPDFSKELFEAPASKRTMAYRF